MKTTLTPTRTDGPWTVDDVWMTIVGPKGEEIAAIHPAQAPGEDRVPRAVAGLNAALIAASPELLDACKELTRVIDALREEYVLGEWPVVREALQGVRAAIRKAQG